MIFSILMIGFAVAMFFCDWQSMNQFLCAVASYNVACFLLAHRCAGLLMTYKGIEKFGEKPFVGLTKNAIYKDCVKGFLFPALFIIGIFIWSLCGAPLYETFKMFGGFFAGWLGYGCIRYSWLMNKAGM